ncbi:small ribosomal subunit biogenesis GTPase RsgA 1, mitochondrial-like isoform X3 [Papaver somniferum]|uniref:small ribosomal subunit biogenesis GTPase RsgA 1, mitochondrial-like isoform X3 n=1 Tax=Papaver somniferum TaxID=3469 RepID=UPI000E7039AA|nr:small ribosomal subunit biogenesis GTPase RsgA 1, mitochondrial-like isoform X3 [Papaver somniferum]
MSTSIIPTTAKSSSSLPTICNKNVFFNNSFHIRNFNKLSSKFRVISMAAARQDVHQRRTQLNKNLLKAKDSVKELNQSSLSPVLDNNVIPQLLQNQAVGMVASAQANFMRVVVHSIGEVKEDEEGKIGVELLCVVKAVLKKIKRRVLVGDKVLVGGQPKMEAFALTRFLIEAESTGIPLTLALNKCELVDEKTRLVWESRLRGWGYEPVFCSVDTRNGLDSLYFILRDQTTVLVGPSGVGKSSLINVLRSSQQVSDASEGDNQSVNIEGSKWLEEQRVGVVSVKSGRGKHTTRHVSLLPISGGGYLADTPGFSQPTLLKATKVSLPQLFPEIRKMIGDSGPTTCSFNDCLHVGERGCVVTADWERYPYYLQLLDEIKTREEFQKRTIGTKRESDVRYKVGEMGVIQVEPRLQLKKHRRQSRKRTNQSFLNELGDDDH